MNTETKPCQTCGVVHTSPAAHQLTESEKQWKGHYSNYNRLRVMQQQLHRRRRQLTPGEDA